MQKELILASASPRRREILNNLGYITHICSADIDETPKNKEKAQDYVLRMAIEKNRAARNKNPYSSTLPLISADTCVALHDQILGKPESPEHAAQMLRQLSGQTHQVLTAICIWNNGQEHFCVQQSDVCFADLSEQEIAEYINTKEPLDKAGAYGIQGLGGAFVKHLSGSFTGVMGLPVFETLSLLKQSEN